MTEITATYREANGAGIQPWEKTEKITDPQRLRILLADVNKEIFDLTLKDDEYGEYVTPPQAILMLMSESHQA